MIVTAFTLGQRFHFLNHPAFPVDEIFTVEKVADIYITAQSDRLRWRDAPMIISNTALAGYDGQIEFLRSGQTVEVVRRKKIHAGQAVPADFRHAGRVADKLLANTPVGQEIKFENAAEEITVEPVSKGQAPLETRVKKVVPGKRTRNVLRKLRVNDTAA